MIDNTHSTRKVSEYVQRVANVFDIEKLIGQHIETHDVVQYYEESNLAYRLLHSLDGSIHMAISSDEQFRYEDYLVQVNYIAQQLDLYPSESVLELGCGTGFNLFRLAQQCPHSEFLGIDLTPVHIQTCRKRATRDGLMNANFEVEDFQHLPYADESWDFVFAVESICHAQDMNRVLQEVHRVLVPGGIFVIFDGFRIRDHATLSEDEKTARYLIEKTLAVNKSVNIQSFISGSQMLGFKLLENTDLSQTILPNLERFHTLARILFELSLLGRLTRAIFPKHFVQNAVAAYLMPILVGNGTQGYFRIKFQKQ